MATCFNDLSFEDIAQDASDNNFDEIAMEYLTEVNELQDDVAMCKQELKEEKLKNLDLKAQNKLLKDLVRNLKYELRQEKESGGTQLRVGHVDPGEISFKTKMLIRKIHEQHGEYLQTGKHENIEENIAELRGLFNLVLVQLNELNSKNKAVTRTLESLTKLDVKQIYFLSKVNIILINIK